MRIVTIWFNTIRNRWSYSAIMAVVILLVCYCPSWGHISRLQQESDTILTTHSVAPTFYDCKFLSKKGKKWQDMSPEEKEKLRKRYKEWQSLSPQEKEEIRQRMKRLNKMSPREREVYRQLYHKWRHLPPDERRQLQKELDHWENLSPQQQEAIRRRFMQ